MTEDRDPILQALFMTESEDLPGDEFVAGVMRRTSRRKHYIYLAGLGGTIILVLLSWMFAWPLTDVAMAFSRMMGIEIIPLGNNLVNLLLLPVNNLATLLIVVWRVARLGWQRASLASYSS